MDRNEVRKLFGSRYKEEGPNGETLENQVKDALKLLLK